MKKGGSQASNAVSQLVSPKAFANLDAMFTNKFSLSGGNTKRKMLQNVDMNETTGSSLMVYNKAGGKKPVVKKPVKKAKAVPKKAVKAVKGGGFTFSGVMNSVFGNPDTSSIPPNTLPAKSSSIPVPRNIPTSQSIMITESTNAPQSIEKTAVYPIKNTAPGSYAFGGGKKAQKPKKAVKKAQKPKKA
jgi:hypothetical protein